MCYGSIHAFNVSQTLAICGINYTASLTMFWCISNTSFHVKNFCNNEL